MLNALLSKIPQVLGSLTSPDLDPPPFQEPVRIDWQGMEIARKMTHEVIKLTALYGTVRPYAGTFGYN